MTLDTQAQVIGFYKYIVGNHEYGNNGKLPSDLSYKGLWKFAKSFVLQQQLLAEGSTNPLPKKAFAYI